MHTRQITIRSRAVSCCVFSTRSSEPQWSYEGSTGPEHWADLSEEWEVARTGLCQSPIDLSGGVETDVSSLEVRYQAAPLKVTNGRHTIQVDLEHGGEVMLAGERYALRQFHFHSPSEHTIDGANAAMEAHLVHSDDRGRVVLLGVLLQPGREHPLLARIWPHLPAEEGLSKEVPNVSVDATQLLPKDLTGYHYTGSLTTPPCSEGVRWVVLCEPMEASQAQLETFRSLIGHNSRSVQPLNGRSLRVGR